MKLPLETKNWRITWFKKKKGRIGSLVLRILSLRSLFDIEGHILGKELIGMECKKKVRVKKYIGSKDMATINAMGLDGII